MSIYRKAWTAVRALSPALGLILLAAVPVEAQWVMEGISRSVQTDVTGPSVTSGDQVAAYFTEPGTVMTMNCPVAWGLRTTADAKRALLTNAEQAAIIPVAGPSRLDAQAQNNVLQLLIAAPNDRAADGAVIAALSTGNDSPAARRAATRLARDMRGLFTVLARTDPLRPGREAATGLTRAVGAYNGFVDASSAEFLARPPAEFAALHAVLNSLVIASLENAARPANASVVDDQGLACAMPVVASAPPPPPPPVEQAIQICALVDGEFRIIAAIRRPELGDTTVIQDGIRRPLNEVYPEAASIPTAPWVQLQEPVTLVTTQYQPFGQSRIVGSGELVRRGMIGDFEYFTTQREPSTPTVIYFPVNAQCEVQPYRAAETIRVRG